MLIDKVPIAVAPQPTTIEGQSHTTQSPFAEPLPQTFGTEVPEQSSRMSDDGRPDYAPPPYESIAAISPPRASTRSILKKSRSASTSTGLEEFDSITQEKARICPLNPEEHTSPCFLRPVPSVSESATSYQRLPRPFVIDSKSGASTLEDSFATVGTPALYRHDVVESDWEELLGDVRTCTRLSSGQRVISGVLPVTRHLGPPGYLASYLAEQGVKRKKTGDVVALLDVWNERFFKPRRLEVILCRGDKRKSGKDIGFLAPDRMDGPVSAPKAQQPRGGCCRRSRGCNGRGQDAVEKPYRLVVVSI